MNELQLDLITMIIQTNSNNKSKSAKNVYNSYKPQEQAKQNGYAV